MGHHHHHDSSTENIKVAFFLNLFFAIIEFIGGVYTNSLAITSDAIHDLGDSISLGMAWYFQNLSNKKEKQCSHQKRRRRKFKYRQGCIYEAGVWRDGFGARDVLHGPNYMHDIQATNPKKFYFHTLSRSEKKEALDRSFL